MGRKKRKGASGPKAPSTGGQVGTSLKKLLSSVELEEPSSDPAPSAPSRPVKASSVSEPSPLAPTHESASSARPSASLRGEDLVAFRQAMVGVRPLARAEEASAAGRVSAAPAEPNADNLARARLGALVAGGVRFEVAHDGDRILGRRAGLSLRVADDLSRAWVAPEADLDLHGVREAELERLLVRWLRDQQRRGARIVRVIHGKGHHSALGLGVLRDAVLRLITDGGAAPVVRAFGTAHRRHGGTGALIVELLR